MSGGHWNYMKYRIDEWATNIKNVTDVLGDLEYRVDRAYCGDDCSDCARTAAYDWVCILLDALAGHSGDEAFLERMEKAELDNLCPRCAKYPHNMARVAAAKAAAAQAAAAGMTP